MNSCRKVSSRLFVSILFCFFPVFAAAQTQTPQKEVAITVDDLPSHGDLPLGVTRTDIAKSMIATFKAKGVPDVYGFVNAGRNKTADEGESLKLWAGEGLSLASHTFSHIDLTTHSAEEFDSEVAANEPLLQSLMGTRDWHWFRYPFLHEGDTLEKRHAVRKYLQEHNYKIAQVTIDFEDYAWNNPYARCVAKQDSASIAWLKSSYLDTASAYIALAQQLAVQTYGRDIKHIFLLHIGAFDALMLPQLLDILHQQGFRFVTLQEAQSDPAYQRDPDAALKYGGTLLEQLTEGQHAKYPPIPEKPMKRLDAICR